ncbi:MAG: guanylate kinase [Phycisphaerales bacterium]
MSSGDHKDPNTHAPRPAGTAPAGDPPRGTLVIVSGPSGAGKTTIARAIERAVPNAVFSVSATTRPMAASDTDGVDYHFMTPHEFTQRIDNAEFLEHAEYAGNRYGTLRAPVDKALTEGRVILLEIDIQGAIQVKSKLPSALAIFILPPSEDDLLRRLRDRKREDESIIQRRFEIAKREIEQARTCGAYDHFVTNDRLERAIDESVALVNNARKRANA